MPRRLPRTAIVIAAVIGTTIAFVVLFFGFVAPDTGGAALSWHGVAAMALGIGFTLIVGVGLMALVFYSHRHGYDDRAAEAQARPRPPED